jgi:hypothetical protein
MIAPRLPDIHPSRITFKPGDRLLVRVSSTLKPNEVRKLAKAVEKFAKEHVRVAIVNCTQITLILSGPNGIKVLAGIEHIDLPMPEMGTANVKCSVVEISELDTLTVVVPNASDSLANKFKDYYQRWAGPNTQVKVLRNQN